MLDLGESIAVGDRRAIVLEQMIEIQAEAIAGGSDARIDDVETELIEGGRGARKPVPAWAGEDQRGGGAAYAARVERHQRLIGGGIALGEQLRVPRDFLRRVLQEVSCSETLPHGGELGFRHAALEQRPARGILRLAYQMLRVDRTLEAAPQRLLHPLIEVMEQRRLPRVPQFRVGGTHIGAGEYVKIVEVGFVADLTREGVDDLRIADVLLLGGDRQQQVVAYQPGGEACIVR